MADLDLEGTLSWRCENCRQWQQTHERNPTYRVEVLDVAPEPHQQATTGLWRGQYFRRVMVVCKTCADAMAPFKK